MIVLIGGGSRSGKSRFALEKARECGNKLAFVATAQLLDDEMRDRAAAHQRERGAGFVTVEEEVSIPRVIGELRAFDAVVVDCLTLWLSNLMLEGTRDVAAETEALVSGAVQHPGTVILVTNEVGCGIVPENELARQFRDMAGRMNQEAATAAAAVYWMAFGCPIRVK